MRWKSAVVGTIAALALVGCASSSTAVDVGVATGTIPEAHCANSDIERAAGEALASNDDSTNRLLAYPSEVEPEAADQQQAAWDALSAYELELQLCMHYLEDQVSAP